MKEYQKPILEEEAIEIEDIMVLSGGVETSSSNPNDDYDSESFGGVSS